MNKNLTWRDAAAVALVDGYLLVDGNGEPTSALVDVRFAVEGGFVHVATPGTDLIQVVSAPAVRVITYRVGPIDDEDQPESASRRAAGERSDTDVRA